MLSIVHCSRWLLRLEKSACLLIIAVTPLLLSCQGSKPTATEYELFIDRAADVWRFQGSYLVAKGDSILVCGSRGLANLTDQRANRPDTKFLIGSMTKPFTAIATLQLVERGLLELDQSIDSYISVYPIDENRAITVHDLLCHRSGIPDVVHNREFTMRMSDSIGPQEIVSYFREEPLSFEPGSQYAYSSSNYVLLGLIIEAVSGSTWERHVKSHICEPAGMENTGVFYDYSTRSDFGLGCALDKSGSLVALLPVHPSVGYAAGALASTVEDLYRLNLALNDTTLLTRPSIEMMLTAHSPQYGYGWLVDDFGGHNLTAHSGGAPGYVSVMQRWPDDSVCVVVLSNNVSIKAHAIANGLAAIAFDEAYEMPQIKTPMAITPVELAEYAGDYRLGSGDIRRVQLQDGKLLVQSSFGPARLVLPNSPDRFYFAHDQMTTLTFVRNPDGEVVAQVIRQAFDQDTAWRSNH